MSRIPIIVWLVLLAVSVLFAVVAISILAVRLYFFPLSRVTSTTGSPTEVVSRVETAPPTVISNPTATSVPARPVETTPSPAPANLRTYHNTTAGFDLDYPADWVVDDTGISNGVILWSRKVEGPGVDGVPVDVAKVDIVIPSVTVQSLEELVAWEKQSIADSSGTILEERQLQLPSGLTVMRLHVSGFDEGVALLAMVNHSPLIISGFGDLSRFDGVAQTLRPSKP